MTEWEKEKRKVIKEQKNEYLKVAMMDPNVYSNEIFFEDSINGILDDYNAELETYPSLMFTDKSYDDYIRKFFKKIIDMVKNINYLINEGNSDYLGIIEDRPHNFTPNLPQFGLNPGTNEFHKRLFKYMENFVLAKKDPVKAKELFLEELEIKKNTFEHV